jgi:hypothetical protein
MMSLVATPVVVSRVAAPKRAARKTIVAKASAGSNAKSAAVAGAVSLMLVAQPALAAMEMAFPTPAAQEIAMVADAGEDAAKKARAKALAASLNAELQAKDLAEGKKVSIGALGVPQRPDKVKSLAAPSVPKVDWRIGFNSGEKKAPKVKEAKSSTGEVRCVQIAAPQPRSHASTPPGGGGIGENFGFLFQTARSQADV